MNSSEKDPESALETRQETTSETSRKGREVSAARLFFFFPDFLYDTRSGITQRRSKAYRSCRSTPSRYVKAMPGTSCSAERREREKRRKEHSALHQHVAALRSTLEWKTRGFSTQPVRLVPLYFQILRRVWNILNTVLKYYYYYV